MVALLCTAPIMATEVQFYDMDGNLLTDVSVDVLTMNASGERQLETVPADGSGVYNINVAPGGKAQLRPWNATGSYIPSDKVIPVDLQGPLQITVVQSTLQATCDTAAPATLNGLTAGSTLGAAPDPLVAGGVCGTSITSGGAWFSVQGNGNTFRASTCEADSAGSADYDTKISVFCLGCDSATLTCVGGNDDSPNCGFPEFKSTIEFCTQAGAEYLIYVHGFGSSAGNFNLAVDDLGTACSPQVDCIPPEPPPPSGACCSCLAPGYNCTIETEAACAARTNDPNAYQGDDTTCFTLGATTTTYAGTGGAIPDASLIGLTTTIDVADDFIVGDLDISLAISHTWVGDVAAVLTNPQGVEAIIIDRPGEPASSFGCSQDNWDITLDDEGTGGSIENLCSALMVSPPNYTPEEALGLLEGGSSQGTWTLFLLDLASPDPGTLDAWSLTMTAGTPVCPDTSGNTGGGPGDGEDDNESSDADYILGTQVGSSNNDGLLQLGFNSLGNDNTQNTNSTRERTDVSKRGSR
jgi:subtilisin-like proprotein convertase family protein